MPKMAWPDVVVGDKKHGFTFEFFTLLSYRVNEALFLSIAFAVADSIRVNKPLHC